MTEEEDVVEELLSERTYLQAQVGKLSIKYDSIYRQKLKMNRMSRNRKYTEKEILLQTQEMALQEKARIDQRLRVIERELENNGYREV